MHLDWFRRHVIMPRCRSRMPAVMREVYPGFLQLSGFLSMNHRPASSQAHREPVPPPRRRATAIPPQKHRDFYDEYLAVMDLTAEFYLQTVDTVFLKHAAAERRDDASRRARSTRRRHPPRRAAHRSRARTTTSPVVGQTEAAQDNLHRHPGRPPCPLSPAEGRLHYGVFNGSRFRLNEGRRPVTSVDGGAWVRRLRAWLRKPRTRAAPGLRPGSLGTPARSWLTPCADQGAWRQSAARRRQDENAAMTVRREAAARWQQRVAYQECPASPGRRVWVETGDDGERRLCVAGEVPHIDRRVGDFLRKEARRDLEQASRALAQKLGVSVKTVSIRDPSSRWGSCSTTGVLSYSWRLILAPPFVLDYLAAHEVAHLVEMNHSQRFWRVVDRLCPNVRRAKAWLDMHGPELHRYGSPRARIEPDVPVDGRRQPRR
jgi:hypothetical protein